MSVFNWRYHGQAHSNLNMTDEYLSLKEAEKHTSKSRSTLRRFVVSIAKQDDHADRKLIQPTVEKVKKLHSENHPFSWMVSVELLDREFSKQRIPVKENPSQNSSSNEMVGLLKQTIAMLEKELNEKNNQIAQFQISQHETNVFIQQNTETQVSNEDQLSLVSVLPKSSAGLIVFVSSHWRRHIDKNWRERLYRLKSRLQTKHLNHHFHIPEIVRRKPASQQSLSRQLRTRETIAATLTI